MNEYLEFRCCMCPNRNEEDCTICPPSHFNKPETPCRFVKSYIDNRRWKYRVMSIIGDGAYITRYQKPGMQSWKGLDSLPCHQRFDEAQADLNRLAKEKGWEELK